MRPLYIFDLDGTLADCHHRLHHIQGPTKDWRAFFAACADDKPIRAGVDTLRMLRFSPSECWVWTGRSDEAHEDTRAWLAKNVSPFLLLGPPFLRMRPAGDHRPDHVLKAEWLTQMAPADRSRLVAVFEDRSTVVQMWRDAGVPCFQVAPGDF